MADTKFSALPPAGTLNGTEAVPVVKTGSKQTTTQAIADLHVDAVSSVNGSTGVVVLTQDSVADGTTYKQYSSTEKTKLAGIAAGAEVNVNADWTAGAGDAAILNKPTLGTASALNVPATGDAAVGEVVKGSDTRLTDSRTPTVHTHAESDVTGLVSDLAAKQATLVSGTNIKTINGSTVLGSGDLTISGGSVSDAVYGAGWNGDTTTAPSKNAVYDKIETLSSGSGLTFSQTYSITTLNI